MSCSQCGAYGVNGICSMCYGDPGHNTDGFYQEWLNQEYEREMAKRAEEEAYLELQHDQDTLELATNDELLPDDTEVDCESDLF